MKKHYKKAEILNMGELEFSRVFKNKKAYITTKDGSITATINKIFLASNPNPQTGDHLPTDFMAGDTKVSLCDLESIQLLD